MKTILLYPAFTEQAQCTNVFPRIFWYFAPYDRYIGSLRGFAPFTDFPLEVPHFVDTASIESEASRKVQNKVKLLPPISSQSYWQAEIDAADLVLVWQEPGSGSNEPFASVGDLRAACGPQKFHLVDEERVSTAASLMMKGALSLMADEEEMLADSKRKLAAFRERISLSVAYVFGSGPSLEETWRYDYSDGHTIVCNSIVKNTALVDHLNPIAFMAGDPIFHAGPSTYAQAFRKYLIQTMQRRDFHVFVPWRDYSIYMTYLPSELHERIIGIPIMTGDDYNLNIEEKFAILGLPNVLTLLLLPVAATYFDHVGISGCDGRPLSQDSYFWGHHQASQFGDQMDAIQLAHPSAFSISYNDYYLRHCSELERFCHQMEGVGKTVNAITASFIPALRKRGAAEPMSPPKGEAEVAPVVLNLAPDLNEQAGPSWSQTLNLSSKVQAGGHPYWVSGNLSCSESMGAKSEEILPATIDRMTFNLASKSDSLFSTDKADGKRYTKLHEKLRREMRAATESALLATEGRVHAYLLWGSFEHAAFLYEVVREQPRLSAQIQLHWFSSNEAWSADFLKQWGWLLKTADRDPRLSLVCATKHQSDAIEARSGIRVPVSPQPSIRLDDDAAWQIINANQDREPEARLYFAANGEAHWSREDAKHLTQAVRRMPDRQETQLVFEGLSPDNAEENQGIHAGSGIGALGDQAPDQERLDWLRNCQAVVLLHMPPGSADRPVPLAIDSVYLGAPILAQRGTSAAEIAGRYKAGMVLDDDQAEDIVEALAALDSDAEIAEADIEGSSKAYFRQNSWQRLAQEVVDAIPTAETAPLVEAAIESERVAVPLIGPVPRNQKARPDEVAAVTTLLASMGTPFKQAAMASGLTRSPLQVFTSKGNGLVLGKSGQDSDDLRDALASKLVASGTLKLHELGDLDAQNCQAAVAAFIDRQASDDAKLLLMNRPGLAREALTFIDQVEPLGAVIAFDDSEDRCHSDLASGLDDRGYLVLISERHPILRPNQPDYCWRVAAFPFLSDLPWAKGMILALPPNASLGYIRQLLIQTGDAMAFVDQDDPERIGKEIWEQSVPADPDRTLAYAEGPGPVWVREAFRIAGQENSGLWRLYEGSTLRVQRTYIGADSRAGSPLTYSVDCAPLGRRFAMLWLSDSKNKTRAGAIFDLETGHPVSTESHLGDPAISVEAASVVIGTTDSGAPFYRIWMTISEYPFTEAICGQLLTREAASGNRQHKGEAGRGLLARDMLLEAWDIPSQVR